MGGAFRVIRDTWRKDMQNFELLNSLLSTQPVELSDDADVELIVFTDDDPVAPHLVELSEDLAGGLVEGLTPNQIRAVLSTYLPEYYWGGSKV